MDALFIVPAMVSQNVNEKVVPALAKVIERNILLNNASMFRDAAMIRYKSSYNKKGLRLFRSEDTKEEMPVYFLSEYSLGKDFFKAIDAEILKSVLEAKHEFGDSDVNNIQTDIETAYRNAQGDPDELKKNLDILKSKLQSKDKMADAKVKLGLDKLGNAKSEKEFELELKKFQNEVEKNSSLGIKNKAEAKDKMLNIKKTELEIQRLQDRKKYTGGTRSAELDYFKSGNQFTSIDQVETPKGITFFSQISLEPTILEIPIKFNMSRDSEDGEEGRLIRIGIKCIPYTVDDVKSLLRLLKEARVMNSIELFFKSKFRDIQTKIPFSTAKSMNQGSVNQDEAANTVKFSPNMSELSSPRKLAKLLTSSKSSPWSTMIILSSFDFKEESDLLEIIKNYRSMTHYVIGDLVITNETKESAYFCTTKMGSCQELSFEYLKKVLNLSNVLDASITSRHRSAAFAMHAQTSKTPMKSAIFEKGSSIAKINKLLKG